MAESPSTESRADELLEGLSDAEKAELLRQLENKPAQPEELEEEPKKSWGDWFAEGEAALEKVSGDYQKAGARARSAAKGVFNDLGGAFSVLSDLAEEDGPERLQAELKRKLEAHQAKKRGVVETEGKET